MKRPDIELIRGELKAQNDEIERMECGRAMIKAVVWWRQNARRLVELCDYVLYLEVEGRKIVEAVAPELHEELETWDEYSDRMMLERARSLEQGDA